MLLYSAAVLHTTFQPTLPEAQNKLPQAFILPIPWSSLPNDFFNEGMDTEEFENQTTNKLRH